MYANVRYNMNTEEKTPQEVKLPWQAHVAAGWPLILIPIGGLLGGLCGGAAYGVSISIMKKKGASVATYIMAVVIGVVGVVLYLGAIVALAVSFPELFNEK